MKIVKIIGGKINYLASNHPTDVEWGLGDDGNLYQRLDYLKDGAAHHWIKQPISILEMEKIVAQFKHLLPFL
jgi:hypothetical protein